MQPKLAITFWQRGLPGVLCIFLGIGLCFVFRNSSPWPAEAKHLAYPLTLILAMSGAPLVSSYVHQRPWSAMRNELLGSGALLAGLLGWQLTSWLGTL
jgi:hypothetical protein